MSVGLQVLVGLSFGSLILTGVWRFNRSRWSGMRLWQVREEFRRG